MAFTTFNPADKSSNVSLDASRLVATSTSTAAGGVRAADGYSGGKFYVEYTFTSLSAATVSDQTGAGFQSATGSISIVPSSANSGIRAFRNNSTTSYLEVQVGSPASNNFLSTTTGITAGALICVAIDLDNELIWVRLGATGNWNNSGTADPATGTGGISIAGAFAPGGTGLYPAAFFTTTSGNSITANFGASAFSGAVPSGFTSGWPAITPGATPLRVTQAGAEAWVSGSGQISVTQVGVEAWFSIIPAIVATQIGAEVWLDNSFAPAGVTAKPLVFFMA